MEAENFETSYYTFFNDYPNANFSLLDFEITGSGDDETMVLTDQDGDYLTYGRQTLSVDENILNDLSIRLKENPVKTILNLNVPQSLGNRFSYSIFTIEGKQIAKGKLSENYVINVEGLNSGMYFLAITSNHNYRQTLKFVKQ